MKEPETTAPPAPAPDDQPQPAPAETPAETPAQPEPAPDPATNPAQGLGTFELLRTPSADNTPVTAPDDDVTAFVLSRRRRSAWDATL